MKTSTALYSLLLLIALLSCNYSKTDEYELSPLPPIELKSNPIPIGTDLLAPSKLFIYKDKLIAYEDIPRDKFKVFNLPDLQYLYSFGNLGGGPKDFTLIDKESINISTYLEVMDNTKIKYIDISDSIADIIDEKKISFSNNPINKLRKVDDSIYFCDNMDMKEKSFEYIKLNTKSKKFSHFSKYPNWGKDEKESRFKL